MKKLALSFVILAFLSGTVALVTLAYTLKIKRVAEFSKIKPPKYAEDVDYEKMLGPYIIPKIKPPNPLETRERPRGGGVRNALNQE